MASTELTLPEDHPAAQGHFPGNPIIPGAVLLSEALRAIEANDGRACFPCTVKSAKFFHPARPGDRVQLEYSRRPEGGIRFQCVVKGAVVLAAELQCSAAHTD